MSQASRPTRAVGTNHVQQQVVFSDNQVGLLSIVGNFIFFRHVETQLKKNVSINKCLKQKRTFSNKIGG
jgi:hypothetical protein